MRAALAQASAAAVCGEVPVAALVTGNRGDGVQLLASAANRMVRDGDPLAHAEILAMRAATQALGTRSLDDLCLWVTLEPCAMCAAAMSHARLGRLIFGAYDTRWGAVEHGPRLFSRPDCRWRPEVIGGVRASEASRLLDDFFRQLRSGGQGR
ncbi:MAG: nucleoside deaminase [Alphaproteobacteria bacterium]